MIVDGDRVLALVSGRAEPRPLIDALARRAFIYPREYELLIADVQPDCVERPEVVARSTPQHVCCGREREDNSP